MCTVHWTVEYGLRCWNRSIWVTHFRVANKAFFNYHFRFYAKENGVKADVSSYGLFINPDECETRGQALIAVRKLNIPIRKKKSKVITEDVVKNADYVVTMTKKQKDALPYDNVFTFSELVGGGDIPDPYGLDQNAYDVTAFRLKLASQNLLNIISKKR